MIYIDLDFTDEPVYYSSIDIERRVIGKILHHVNKFSIDNHHLPKDIKVDLETYAVLSDSSGYSINPAHKLDMLPAGSIMGLSIYLDPHLPMMRGMDKYPKPEYYFELSSDELSIEYYINRDMQKDRSKKIKWITDE